MQTAQLAPINNVDEESYEENDGASLQEDMGDFAELEYFCQAASQVATQGTRGAANPISAPTSIVTKAKSKAAATTNNDEFIGLDNQAEEQKHGASDVADYGEDEIGLIDKLREENKRLKKTLLDKF